MKIERVDELESKVTLDEVFVTNDSFNFRNELEELIEKYRI